MGSIVCHGLAGKQDLRRPMPNGRPLAMQVEQASKGQSRYAPYYVEGEKPLRKERDLWPFGHDDHDDHDHHHDDHFQDHHHDSHDHYDEHVHHRDEYEHLHEHGFGRGISEGFREGEFAGRPMGPNWG